MTQHPLQLHLELGARDSRLSMIQTRAAVDSLHARFPALTIDIVPSTSPGDEDRQTDLRQSAPDFFTRYLDQQVLDGKLDGAVHSAKDLPEPMTPGLDWCWLPWIEDRRDVLVLRRGMTPAELPPQPVAGISSDRREEYCREHFPNAVLKPIRGNVPARIAQLDAGDFDLIVTAGAALNRLGLEDRITRWIPLAELASPPGQGALALTFREGDERFRQLRRALGKAVAIIPCTDAEPAAWPWAAVEAIRHASLLIADDTAPAELLAERPDACCFLSVGPDEASAAVMAAARQGQRTALLVQPNIATIGQEALSAAALPWRRIETGQILRHGGPLRGCRVLLTASARVMPAARQAVDDHGGIPVCRPLIELVPEPAARPFLVTLDRYDWLVLTSPSAVDCLVDLLQRDGGDIRRVPRLLVCGPGVQQALVSHGLSADAGPTARFGGDAMLAAARDCLRPGDHVLRLRSDLATTRVAEALTELGAEVDDCILYRNRRRQPGTCPTFDAAFFASASAVDALVDAWGVEILAEKPVAAIGDPTARGLARHGLGATVIGAEATAGEGIATLAGWMLR